MAIKRERIACAAVAIKLGALTVYDPIAPNTLVMDRINWYLKNRPDLEPETTEFFITTQGRGVDAHEAFDIAFNANQIYTDKTKAPLSAIDIWPRK